MRLQVDPGKRDTVLPRLVRAAVRLFVEKGIDGTTTRDIALKAKVSEGALYRHFKSKNELAWHIFSTHVNRFALELSARVAGEKTMKDKIRAYISYCFESFEEDPDLFTYLIVSEHRELAHFPVTHVHPGHVARQLMEEGVKRGALRKVDPVAAGAILFGAVHRLCLVRVYKGLPGGLKGCAEEATAALWEGLKK